MEFSPNRRKAVALVILVFLLGIAFGVVGMLAGRRVLSGRNQGDGRPRELRQLTRELNLTPDQERQFAQILADLRTGYDLIREEMDPRFQEVQRQSREGIRQILTAEQRPGFDDFLRGSGNRRNDRSDRTPSVTRLTRELNLTADQQAQLSEILRDTRARFDALRQEMEPRYGEVRQQNRERMRQIVTPEQKPGLENFLQRLDDPRRRR